MEAGVEAEDLRAALKRGRTIYRRLRARGVSERVAAKVAAGGRRW